MTPGMWRVLVTGGAGYVGSALVPRLLEAGHRVTVLDLFIYGEHVFAGIEDRPDLRGRLTLIKGDVRDPAALAHALRDTEAVIHLACISNDPSFDLDPALGKSINYDAFLPLVRASKAAGVRRFIYASSSSVYGVKEESEVTEDLPLEPLTDYSRFKALCEEVLQAERTPGFMTLVLRPATVCGYAPRLRLDLSVCIMTNHAINRGQIKVFGGNQQRPHIHIDDMVELYLACLRYPDEAIDGKVFNAGYENHTILEIAEQVRDVVGRHVPIEVTPTDDLRSYRISSQLIFEDLGFRPRRTIADAVESLRQAFAEGRVSDPMNNPLYYNVKRMRQIGLR